VPPPSWMRKSGARREPAGAAWMRMVLEAAITTKSVVKAKISSSKRNVQIEEEEKEPSYEAKADETSHVIYSLLF
jgi:hypothetical protein